MLDNPFLVITGVAIAIAVIFYVLTRYKHSVKKVQHDYFHRLWLWPPGSHTRWEAELDLDVPGVHKPLGIHAETTHEEITAQEPTEMEVTFCRDRLEDPDALFKLCEPAIREAWKDWVKAEFPQDWKSALSLEGFSVPRDGDMNQTWGVTYFCDPADHYFSIQFQSGTPRLESVDG